MYVGTEFELIPTGPASTTWALKHKFKKSNAIYVSRSNIQTRIPMVFQYWAEMKHLNVAYEFEFFENTNKVINVTGSLKLYTRADTVDLEINYEELGELPISISSSDTTTSIPDTSD